MASGDVEALARLSCSQVSLMGARGLLRGKGKARRPASAHASSGLTSPAQPALHPRQRLAGTDTRAEGREHLPMEPEPFHEGALELASSSHLNDGELEQYEQLRRVLEHAWHHAMLTGDHSSAWRGLAAASHLGHLGYSDADVLGAAILGGMVASDCISLEDVERIGGPSIARATHGASRVINLRSSGSSVHQSGAKELQLYTLGLHGPKAATAALAQRLQTYRRAGELSDAERSRLGMEGFSLFGPLATALGESNASLAQEVEEASMHLLLPESFPALKDSMDCGEEQQMHAIMESKLALERAYKDEGLDVRVTSRRKQATSTMRKLLKDGRGLSNVRDFLGLRAVVTGTDDDCYKALDTSHNALERIEGRLKDYVQIPRGGLYRSLHTALVAPNGLEVELQLRTESMDREAEAGQAAHAAYKAAGGADAPDPRRGQLLAELASTGDLQDWDAATPAVTTASTADSSNTSLSSSSEDDERPVTAASLAAAAFG